MRRWRSRMFIRTNRDPLRRAASSLATALAVVLTITLIDVPGQRAAAAPAPGSPRSAQVKAACPAEMPDEPSAAVAAKLCDGRVEVAGRRTEATRLFVNPNGTLTQEQALAPVRFKRDGQWVDVDLTLQRGPDGSVTPKAHPNGLRFGAPTKDTGEHEVVSLGEGDRRTGVSWRGALPEPTLDGRRATYPDVMPGVDLVFEAHASGYQQFFVAKNREALARVRSLSLPMRTGKLTPTADGMGGLLFKDGKGRAVGRAQTPEMWDAKVSPLSLEHVNRARVGLRTQRRADGVTVMQLTPDAEFLARQDLAFPVTIDPPSSMSPAFDAFVQTGYTSDQSGVGELKLGYVSDGGTWTARSYLRFDTGAIWDTQIITAQLRLWNYHSFNCNSSQWEAWRTDYVDSSVRWGSWPAQREWVGTSWETKGYNSSCGDGWVYIDIARALQASATNHWTTASVMLKATSEVQGSWKRFHSAEGANPPLVSITYDSPPAVPSALSVLPCYSSCSADARTSAARPTLSAKLGDVNTGQTLQAEFEVRDKNTTTVVATSGLLSGSPVWTNGATASWQVSTNLTHGTTYQWRVRGKDPIAYGSWSAWTDMTVDTAKPLVPFVSATIYLNDSQPHGGASQPDTFTLTPAAGTDDLAAFVYKLDYDASATTIAATGTTSVTIAPRDGHRTLTVQAKDRAGNLSDPNLYVFEAGNAALAMPLPGANIIKRTKLQVTTPVAGYTRTYFEYRRGPGGATLPVPSTNLTSATGAPITATAASPVGLASLGGYAIWNATDTLGVVGGVVEVRAQMYTASGTTPVYTTAWVRVTVDTSGAGGSTEEIGPGAVNLLTGDFSTSTTDAEEQGLSVARTFSSRQPGAGYLRMPERLTANQKQVSTDLTGFTVPSTSSAVRSTARGQGEVTPADSLEITPVSGNDTYVTVGGDNGALRLNMAPGKTYRMTGWIFVPAGTGLDPAFVSRGLRIVGFQRVGGVYSEVASPMAAFTEGWQELSVDLTVPAGATEAFFRLYNGMNGGSGRKVYWDNLSFTEIVAPFGPSWSGGATGGPADSEFTTITLPQPSVAQVNTIDGGWLTFSLNADGVSYTPEPGAEGMVLTKHSATAYRLAEIGGTVAEFTQQGGVWTLTSSWTAEASSTTRYGYDTSGGRMLPTKVINPVESGVDDANACTATLVRGCEVLEYQYATSTTAGLSQTVFGDFTDRVVAAKLWTWNPTTSAVTAVEIARYAYDNLGRLRTVHDPRITPTLATSYEYDSADRVVTITPPGELPWMVDYANPDVDSAALRWDLDAGSGTAVADTSGAGRNGTLSAGIGWGEGNDGGRVGDKALTFTAASGAQVSVSGAALSNTSSYTVSAWARLTEKSVNRTVVSKDGASTSGFFLNYVAAIDRWAFSRVSADNTSATPIRATSDTAPVLGQWTHVAGVYDTASGTMRLYINGVAQATTAATGGWNASGNYVIGRAKWAGAATNLWHGSIDDVRVYPGALTADQVADLAGDEHPGRTIRVRRAGLQQGSKTVTDGEMATNVVYNVPLTTGKGGPHSLDATSISTWGQIDLPTDATAMFGPQDSPGRNSATPATPGTGGYAYATVHYLNAHGQEVNTATPGGYIDTQEYDRFGNVVRGLTSTDRALALGQLPGFATTLAELGLLTSDQPARALALSTVNTYSADGTDLLDVLSPTLSLVVENDVADPDGSGPLQAIAAGSTVIARPHRTNVYDQGKPDGATYHLVTTETQGAQIVGYPEADRRVKTFGYNAHSGGVSGWTLKKFTTMVSDAVSGGANLTARTVYDQAGRTLKAWGIESDGADAATREMIYYTAGTNSADSACGNRPEWTGLVCVVRAAATITGHDPGRMADQLPLRRVTRYSRFGEPEEVIETAAGKTRTTTTIYDDAGRNTSVSVTSDEGTAVAATTTTYDPATGATTQTTRGTATIGREYDLLGRLVRYTDVTGAATVTEFDRFGQLVKVSNPTGWSTFGYDRVAEPRGYATTTTDSIAGTFSAKYTPDGQLYELKYPGGLTRTDRLDANQQPVERRYVRDSDNELVYSESVVENSAGQVVNHAYTGGSKIHSYDRLGRLERTRHDTATTGGCVTRTYTYDGRTNRTDKRTYGPDGAGDCQETTLATHEEHDYDSADRLTDGGYGYDAFGRITAAPGALANTFFVNDQVAGQQLGDARLAWTLDPADRRTGFTSETLVEDVWQTTSSKVNHYGDDSDEPRWIVEDTATNALTRMVSGLDNDLVATTSATGDVRLRLTNLQGSVAATIDVALTAPELFDYDEFGAPVAGQAEQRYGWLGGKQRSAEALGGLVLMGVRLYSPAIGRFLQMDPVDGGNATAYDYCSADPINCADLDGRWGLKSLWNGVKAAAKFVKDNPALVASTVAMFTPPPINVIAGAVAVGFSIASAYSNVKKGNWGGAALDVLGAIPGAGGAFRGAKAIMAASKMKKIVPRINLTKGFEGAKKLKRGIVKQFRSARKVYRENLKKEKFWNRWDRWAAYPVSVAQTGCKYWSSCSQSTPARFLRLF